MNAFDATKAGVGDTGLASLFAAAATTPANGQGTQSAAQGATPFAQLLDQLNALPMPQDSAPPAPLAPVTPNALSPSPVRQARQLAGESPPLSTQADHAPVLECGLRLPVIGKMLPPVGRGGTILPAELTIEAVPGDQSGMVAELPVADPLTVSVSEGVAAPFPPMVAQPIMVALQPFPIVASAMPMRSAAAGAARTDQRTTGDPAAPAAAAPAIAAAPAGPAVTLTAADAPVAGLGEPRAAPEHASKEVPIATAPTRSPLPGAEPLATTSIAEPVAAAPQLRPEPQQSAMQDLTQIVERLAAAREAAAPAATRLAVEHAEFGPLSVSIQQGDRGELAIAVAAVDRDSQAALVAAIAQGEAPGFEQAPERRGGEAAPRDSAAAGQHADQRGQGTQRDRLAGQQQRQTMPQREPAGERDGETRSGTYA